MSVTGKRSQILQLSPLNEIVFEGPFQHVVTSYLKLNNPSSSRVCFKVKTTAPKRYCVRPNSGIVEPSSEVKIAIMLQPIENDSINERSKHKFMVQSAFIPDDSSNPDSVWQDTTKVMDSKLRCVFLPGSIEEREPSTGKRGAENENMVTRGTSVTSQQQQQPSTTLSAANSTQQQQQTMSSQKLQQSAAGDGQNASRPNESTILPTTSTPSKGRYSNTDIDSSNLNLRRQRSANFDADKSLASSSSFLQPLGDDYKIIIVSLAMLFIGMILGKYII